MEAIQSRLEQKTVSDDQKKIYFFELPVLHHEPRIDKLQDLIA